MKNKRKSVGDVKLEYKKFSSSADNNNDGQKGTIESYFDSKINQSGHIYKKKSLLNHRIR